MTANLTLGDVARQLGVPRNRVEYAVEKAGIRERGRVGILRVYGEDQVGVIAAAIAAVRTRAPKNQK